MAPEADSELPLEWLAAQDPYTASGDQSVGSAHLAINPGWGGAMDWLMDGLIELLAPDISSRKFRLSTRIVRRMATELQQSHDEAMAAGEPLVCDFPASLRILLAQRRGVHFVPRDELRQTVWTPGLLKVTAAGLAWEPFLGRPSKQKQPMDLAAAEDVREVPLVFSANPNRAVWNLCMQVREQQVEVALRLAFLPFARIGLDQSA